MKKLLALILVLCPILAFGQYVNPTPDYQFKGRVSVGTDTDSYVPSLGSAWLTVGPDSTNKGMVLPRVVDTSDITSPVIGMTVYQLPDSSIYMYTGKWGLLVSGSDSVNLYISHNQLYNNNNSVNGAWNFKGDTTIFNHGISVNGIPIYSGGNTGFNINVGGLGQLPPLSMTGNYNNTLGYGGQHHILTGIYNDNLGSFGQYNITTGQQNVNMGFAGQYGITTGFKNINVGYQGQYNQTIGSTNINVGYHGQFFLSNDSNNVNLGTEGMVNLISGHGNVNVGHQGLYFLKYGSNNISIGKMAGAFVNDSATSNLLFIGKRDSLNAPDSSLTIMGDLNTRKLKIPGYTNYNNNPVNVLSTNSTGDMFMYDVRNAFIKNDSSIVVLKDDSTYYIRTNFTDTTDIVQQVSFAYNATNNQGKFFDFIATYLVSKSTPNIVDSITSGTMIDNSGDDGAPLNTYENGYLGEGHGALLTSVKAETLLDSIDIGSKWQDSTGNVYYLANISNDTLAFWTQHYIAPGYSPRTYFAITGSFLVADSGAVHTDSIKYTSQFYTQQYPVTTYINQSVTLNGFSIQNYDDGVYYGTNLIFYQSYGISNISYLKIQNPFLFNSANSFVDINQSFNYSSNASVLISQYMNFRNMTVDSPKHISDYGGVQAVKLLTSTKFPNVYAYIPDVKPIGGYDYASIVQTNTSPPLANFDSSYRVNHNIPPDRDVQLLGNSDGKKLLSFAIGYIPNSDNGSSDNGRVSNAQDWMLSAAAKSYPYQLYNYVAVSQQVKTSAYRSFATVPDSLTSFYYVPYNDDYYLYIDSHNNLTNYSIDLPSELRNKKISLYRSIGGFSLNSSGITSDKINVSVTDDYGYGIIILSPLSDSDYANTQQLDDTAAAIRLALPVYGTFTGSGTDTTKTFTVTTSVSWTPSKILITSTSEDAANALFYVSSKSAGSFTITSVGTQPPPGTNNVTVDYELIK